MRICAREADRGERTDAAAKAAVLADIKREVSASFLSRLREIATEKEGSLFDKGLQVSPVVGDEGSVLEGQICEAFQRHIAGGCSHEEAAIAGLEDALGNAWTRERER
jgi:hypothetical protein